MPMIIKVCGMREAENIRAVEALGADWIGLVFWPGSKRCVTEVPAYLPQRARRVGVFVDESPETVARTMAEYGLDILQLHGQESPAYITQLKERLREAERRFPARKAGEPPIVKAFNIATPDDLIPTQAYEGVADYFLFDTKGKALGGNGASFDWHVLDHYHGATPFLLSGGIGPDSVGRIAAFRHPRCVGIDLNSRFETAPGLKDADLLRTFMQRTRR